MEAPGNPLQITLLTAYFVDSWVDIVRLIVYNLVDWESGAMMHPPFSLWSTRRYAFPVNSANVLYMSQDFYQGEL